MSERIGRERDTWFVIPCGAEKLDRPAAARDLYVGSSFRLALAAALTQVDEAHVLILSAKHGLLALDTIVAPYDMKMGDADSIDTVNVQAQALGHGMTWDADVYSLLPRAYFAKLNAALYELGIYAADVYEADAGIGYQRGTCASQVRAWG